jgi:hypothetical protein
VDYTVVLDDTGTCIIPAVTRLNVGGAAPATFASGSGLASFPTVRGTCEGKVNSRQKLLVPHTVIKRTRGGG